MSVYRPRLREKFIQYYPDLSHISEQRISDQYRAIIKNKLLHKDKIENIRQEIERQVNNTNPGTLNTDTTLNSHQQNILPRTNPLTSTNTVHVNVTAQNHRTEGLDSIPINQNTRSGHLDPHIIEKQFNSVLEQFRNVDPTSRPYIPKQKPSRKLAFITECLNKNILPKHLHVDQDFITLHAIIYSAAYTAAVCNNTRILNSNQTNATRQNRKPPWQKRLENKIKQFRLYTGRLTEYIRGNRNRNVVRTVEEIKMKFKTHATYENPNTELEHFLDTQAKVECSSY